MLTLSVLSKVCLFDNREVSLRDALRSVCLFILGSLFHATYDLMSRNLWQCVLQGTPQDQLYELIESAVKRRSRYLVDLARCMGSPNQRIVVSVPMHFNGYPHRLLTAVTVGMILIGG